MLAGDAGGGRPRSGGRAVDAAAEVPVVRLQSLGSLAGPCRQPRQNGLDYDGLGSSISGRDLRESGLSVRLPRSPERRLGLVEAIGHPAPFGVTGIRGRRGLGRRGLAAAPVPRQTGEGVPDVDFAPTLLREVNDDQVDCCCRPCVNGRNIGASHNARANSPAG
jgi:hypothetical protein